MSDSYDEFRWYDYVVFAAVLCVSLGIGVYYAFTGGKQKTTKEYHLGDRQMGVIPVGLSIYVTNVSAILIMGSTAEMYQHGVTTWWQGLGGCFGMVVGSIVFVPIVYGLGYTSSFTYLEKRFNSKVLKLSGSLLTIIQSSFYMGLAIYSPAIALEGVTGISFVTTVIVTGAVVTAYSTVGGLKAVVGSDTFQAIVMLIGCLLVVILGSINLGGIDKAWDIAKEGGRMDVDYTPTPYVRMSFWTSFVGTFVYTFYMPVRQAFVQRIVATGSTKDAKMVLFMYFPLNLIMVTLVYLCGMIVFAYYEKLGCDPLRSGQITSSNQLLPYFIMDGLKIPALPGLFVSVLFCGALSSVSSHLNSLTAITWKDFLEWRFKHLKESQKALFNKIIVLIYGVISVIFAFLFNYGKGNVIQMSNTLFGCFVGPIVSIFIMGMFFPQAEWLGTLIGMFVGFALTATITIGNSVEFPWAATLPTNISQCEVLGYNVTEELPINKEVFSLFMISYQWYYTIAPIICITVGITISIVVRLCNHDRTRPDPRLLIPVFDILLCCLPAKLRHKLQCGVEHGGFEKDELGRYEMTGLEEDADDADEEKDLDMDEGMAKSDKGNGVLNDGFSEHEDLQTKF